VRQGQFMAPMSIIVLKRLNEIMRLIVDIAPCLRPAGTDTTIEAYCMDTQHPRPRARLDVMTLGTKCLMPIAKTAWFACVSIWDK
jgi:hypothetical protein